MKDEKTGDVVELRCTFDPKTRSGSLQEGRKVKGTLHWVSAEHVLKAEVRLYDRLFTVEDPGSEPDMKSCINPQSLEVLKECYIEPSLKDVTPGSIYQFLRLGYFCVDPDSKGGSLVFNRTVSLRDTWAKIEKAQKGNKNS